MGWLDTADGGFADAVAMLATVTHRPVRVVPHCGGEAVRVDFEFGRYVLARKGGPASGADPDADGTWTVSVHDVDGHPELALARATDEWLVDAFDLVADVVRVRPTVAEPCTTGELTAAAVPAATA